MTNTDQNKIIITEVFINNKIILSRLILIFVSNNFILNNVNELIFMKTYLNQ